MVLTSFPVLSPETQLSRKLFWRRWRWFACVLDKYKTSFDALAYVFEIQEGF